MQENAPSASVGTTVQHEGDSNPHRAIIPLVSCGMNTYVRDQLGIAPGDEVDFSLDGSAVRVEPVRNAPNLRGSLKGRGLVLELEADRRAERDR